MISPPYTPQQNPFAERSNRTILDKARCLLHQSNLPLRYWAEAVYTATDLINLLPSKTGNCVPYKVWFGKEPRLNNLRSFGCLCYVYNRKEIREKLELTCAKGIFSGYAHDFTSYKVLKLKGKTVINLVHVRFEEDIFPGLIIENSASENEEKKS